jgi:ABC-type amino acid transport substrate-binding protein
VVTPRTGPLAPFIQKTAPSINLVLTANYEESLAQLVNGQADAAALNFQVGEYLANKLYPNEVMRSNSITMQSSGLAVGVLKGQHSDLIARLNAGLASIKADGTWQKINDAWTGRS